MGRTRHTRKRHTRKRHTRKRHTRRKHKRKRTRHRLGGTTNVRQVFGGYKESLGLVRYGGDKTYGISDYPPGFSKFTRRDKRKVDAAKRKSRKRKRRRKRRRKH